MEIVEHAFVSRGLVAGHVALDFINTVTARDQPQPKDWLGNFGALLQWAALTDRFPEGDLARVRTLARRHPEQARHALLDATRTREAIHAVLSALVARTNMAPRMLSTLQDRWRVACGRARFRIEGERVKIEPAVEASRLEWLADTLVLDAVEFMRTVSLDRLRCCAGSHCGWHFLDTSKAGRRRWCDMATCGNAAKADRYQQKARARP